MALHIVNPFKYLARIRLTGFPAYFVLYIVYYAAVYFYFAGYRMQTIYGDDLAQYRQLAGNTNLADIIATGKDAFKFRPVYGIVGWVVVLICKKNLASYFLFNVAMQAMTGVIFTAIANRLLRSFWVAALVGLLVGLSRFAYYGMIQVLCGGPMEDLAMVLFVAALYHLVMYLTCSSDTCRHRPAYYLWCALVFANLAVYTHERYLVMFPLIILLTLFHRSGSKLPIKRKLGICTLSALSVFMNYALKTYVYHYRFLMGTQTSSITHDFKMQKQLGYLGDALASIVQFNAGPAYQRGIEFKEASLFHRWLIVLVSISLCIMVIWYMFSLLKERFKGNPDRSGSIKLIFFLSAIFVANLVPAVITIDLIQRWFQAPFVVFIVIVMVIYMNIKTLFKAIKKALFIFFVICFLVSDYYYMASMISHFWMKSSEWVAANFRNAAESGATGKDLNTIYIVEDKLGEGVEVGFTWALMDGYFYDFYQGKSKRIIYIDSNKFKDPIQLNYMINFDKNTEQIIRFKNEFLIVTDEVLKEREKYFKEHGITARK